MPGGEQPPAPPPEPVPVDPKVAKARAAVDKALKERGLEGEDMFKNTDDLTVGKVKNALESDPMGKSKATQQAAQRWAVEGSDGSAREFANRYEYAKGRFGYERNAALEARPGDGNAAKAAAEAKTTPEELTSQLGKDIASSKDLGPGQRITGVTAETPPGDVAQKVKELERIGWETETAEAYHSYKHAKELPAGGPGVPSRTGDVVKDYAAFAQDTVKNGRVVLAEPAGAGKTRVVIHHEYGEGAARLTLEAIIYVEADGTVTMASLGAPKAVK